MVRPFDELFPALAQGGFQITSPPDQRYNCIAFAASDSASWWWPFPIGVAEIFWPAGVPRAETVDAFRDAFATLDYAQCNDEDLETGFEKIAIFSADKLFPLHAARQLGNGRWTSKIGEREDIEHALHDLEGVEYGYVVLIMKRPIATAPTA